MGTKRVFVTVGTTKFPKLVDIITTEDIIETLISLGYNFVQIQTGNDFDKPNIDENILLTTKVTVVENSTIVDIPGKIKIKYDRYFEDFRREVESSDLVISHAGAGTCLEVLRQKKPLIVVVNEDLMDNHQIELAEQLEIEGYAFSSTCSTLKDVLKKDLAEVKPFPEADKFTFPRYLDKCMGFAH